MTIPLSDATSSGVLDVTSHYFEFIPEAEGDNPNPTVLAAHELKDLKSPPGNRLHALKNDRVGQYAIRINDQFRVCFRWRGGDAYEVEITDYH